ARAAVQSGGVLASLPPEAPKPVVKVVTDQATDAPAESEWQQPYRVAALQVPSTVDGRAVLEDHPSLARLVTQVVDVEGPIHRELVMQRITEACGVRRAGSRIQDCIGQAVSTAAAKREIVVRDGFLWPKGLRGVLCLRVPVAGDPATKRSADQIPPEEYALALGHLVARGVGMDREALIVQAARVFGFDRAGARIVETIGGALDRCVARGTLLEQAGRITASARADGPISLAAAAAEPRVTGATAHNGALRMPAEDSAERPPAPTHPAEPEDPFDLARFFRRQRIEVIDKRGDGGRLWVIAGPELGAMMADLERRGAAFTFVAAGGKATSHRAAWYLQ
ncbi:MAG TPA: DUF3320 domain-containing protein, partial [Bacillota bacterium]|nr:DUF3320 domain-containing protein [Bacillota bacterium]